MGNPSVSVKVSDSDSANARTVPVIPLYPPRMQVHLLDGTYELFRSYFGAPPRKTPEGDEIGAVHGLLHSTLTLLEDDGVTHLAAAFDTEIRSFRNDRFAGYKTEEGVPSNLLSQFPLAEEGMAAIGVTVWSMIEFEADDAIATAATRFADAAERVVMMTPDKDLAQCVSGDHVVGFDRRKGKVIDEAGVWEKFGVAPESIPDYLALVGDSADGLPGLRGWGAKSSSLVLAEYSHLENIPLDAAAWGPKVRGAERLVEALRDGMGDALLYRELATLRTDVPLSESLEDLEWQGVPRGPFLAFCDRFGFGSIRDKPTKWRD
jgi:5'-3' exonuclease